MPAQPDLEQRVVRRYRNALRPAAENLPSDLSSFMPGAGGSTYEEDKSWAAGALHKQRVPRSRILHASMQHCSHKMANVVDHLAAIASVLELDPLRPYSPTSLARVAVEAATGLRYLLDTSVDPEERFLRAAALLMESFHYEVKATRELPVDRYPGVADGVEERLAKLVEQVTRSGLDVKVQPVSRQPSGIRWTTTASYRSVPPAKVTDLVRVTFADYPALYQMGSGVAHSMSWMLDDNARLPEDGGEAVVYAGDAYTTGAAVISAIASAEVVLSAFGRYMGHDPEPKLVLYRRRREAMDTFMNGYAASRMRSVGRL
ncbi:hypothetical protein AB0B66_18775 [Catellatospora sp. NPDC049111]|uniref:hypothetical protein n=1 Tax=Catellatospora sp. NPDC049111 TaxID=3155271 RepID=UPI0033C75AB1